MSVRRAISVRRAFPALLAPLLVGPAVSAATPAQSGAPRDTAAAPGPAAGQAASADTVTYGSCPDSLGGPSDVPGVAWGDSLAAADSLAPRLEVDALADARPGRLIRRGDRAAAAGHHTTAFAAYAAAAEAPPAEADGAAAGPHPAGPGSAGYEPLWKAARAAVDVGQALDDDGAEGWYGVAEAYARRAVQARPGAPEGHLHLAQALGLVALDADVRRRVRLSEEIRREARAAIEADSAFAGGWHVLGRWHRGVMELSGAGRFFARTFLGGEVLGEASWEEATRYLERAAELEPGRIVHHLELGRIHRERDRPAAARERLRRALELPPRDYRDCVYRRQARRMLEETGDG